MGEAAIIRPVLSTIPLAFNDPAEHRQPKLTYRCAMEYQAWVHVIRLGVRYRDPRPIHDARNVLCRALMDLGIRVDFAQAEAKAAVRKPGSSTVINGVRYVGTGVDGKRFRTLAVDVGELRLVTVVPASQQEICVEISDVEP